MGLKSDSANLFSRAGFAWRRISGGYSSGLEGGGGEERQKWEVRIRGRARINSKDKADTVNKQ